METEFDIRPYLRALAKHWRSIGVLTLLAAVAAGLYALMLPVTYTATSVAFMQRTQSQVSLDERFVTNEAIDTVARRRSLLALAASTTVEAQIPAETRARFVTGDYRLGVLANRINIRSDGDLVLISASAPSAEQARDLADTWAEVFVSYVNQLYKPVVASVEQSPEVKQAIERYEKAQQAFEQSFSSDRTEELNERITAVNGVITKTLRVAQDRHAAYLDRVNEYELVLRDAEALRAEIDGTRPVRIGERLGALALRARAAGGEDLPLQFQFDQAAVSGEQEATTASELDALIASLKRQIADTREAATKLGAALASQSFDRNSSLTDAQFKAYYAELQDLRREREAQLAKVRASGAERDVAFEALQVVRRKIVEQQVAALQPYTEVRLAEKAMLPQYPSGPRTLAFVVPGIATGLLVGGVLALLVEVAGVRLPLPGSRARREHHAHSPSST